MKSKYFAFISTYRYNNKNPLEKKTVEILSQATSFSLIICCCFNVQPNTFLTCLRQYFFFWNLVVCLCLSLTTPPPTATKTWTKLLNGCEQYRQNVDNNNGFLGDFYTQWRFFFLQILSVFFTHLKFHEICTAL